MIYQSVTSEIISGKVAQYDSVVLNELLPIMSRYGVKLIGAWHGYSGDPNKVYSLYAYDNLAAYEQWVKARQQDPDFMRVSGKLQALRTRLNYTFLDACPWSPLK